MKFQLFITKSGENIDLSSNNTLGMHQQKLSTLINLPGAETNFMSFGFNEYRFTAEQEEQNLIKIGKEKNEAKLGNFDYFPNLTQSIVGKGTHWSIIYARICSALEITNILSFKSCETIQLEKCWQLVRPTPKEEGQRFDIF